VPGGNEENGDGTRQSRGLRLDLLIAVCALLISSFASAASWWQARLLSEQTRVLEQQLGAQVWPYIGISDTIDNATVTINVVNNGLGPAVIRSETARVDGVPMSSMVDVLHKILGPHLAKRKPHGEKMRLALNCDGPGSVLRSGESTSLMTLTSKRFAAPFILESKRITFQVCYCAIVPGQCWFAGSSTANDPQPLPACHEVPNDLMHASPAEQLNENF